MRYYSGNGLLNNAINKLPFEMHIPGYQFCGPGTKLKKRLARGDTGINPLDEACKEHDITYSLEKNLENRHNADKILATKAMERFHSSNASIGEKMAALGVAGAMKTKVRLGMGYNRKAIINKKCLQMFKKNLKLIDKVKKNCENNLKLLENYISSLKQNIDININSPIKKEKTKKKLVDKIVSNDSNLDKNKSVVSRKRKKNFNNDDNNVKLKIAKLDNKNVIFPRHYLIPNRKRKYDDNNNTFNDNIHAKKIKYNESANRKRKLLYDDDENINIKKIKYNESELKNYKRKRNEDDDDDEEEDNELPNKQIKLL